MDRDHAPNTACPDATRDKPFVLCEYAHSMGNAFGAVDKYLDLADREPLFQGCSRMFT